MTRRDGEPGGRLHREPVAIAATAATLAAWGGGELDAAPPLDQGPPPTPEAIYLESLYARLRHGWSSLRAWREGDLKVIRAPRPEVYDLGADPGETHDLADSASERAREMLAALAAPRFAAPTGIGTPDPEVEEALASLGYASVSRNADPSRSDDDLPDPKDHVSLEAVLGRIGAVIETGDLASARNGISIALSIAPDNKETLLLLARVEARAGNAARAREVFSRCLRLSPASLDPLVHYEAGRLELDLGRWDAAEAHFAASVSGDPLNADAVYNWGLAAYRAGRYGDAADRWEQVLRLAPEHPLAGEWLPDARGRARGEAG
jgi:tetratricopeptide (TPR) repeat protein